VWFLVGEILIALVIAALIGLVVGWLLGRVSTRRGGAPSESASGADGSLDLQEQLSEREAEIEHLRAELAPYRSDDLKLINGIGPVFERTLNAMGYSTYDQVAAWTRDDIRAVAAEIDLFPDRIIRDQWVEQAAALGERAAAAADDDDDGVESADSPESPEPAEEGDG